MSSVQLHLQTLTNNMKASGTPFIFFSLLPLYACPERILFIMSYPRGNEHRNSCSSSRLTLSLLYI